MKWVSARGATRRGGRRRGRAGNNKPRVNAKAARLTLPSSNSTSPASPVLKEVLTLAGRYTSTSAAQRGRAGDEGGQPRTRTQRKATYHRRSTPKIPAAGGVSDRAAHMRNIRTTEKCQRMAGDATPRAAQPLTASKVMLIPPAQARALCPHTHTHVTQPAARARTSQTRPRSPRQRRRGAGRTAGRRAKTTGHTGHTKR